MTVRELDGSEYQLKRRIGQQIVKAGYARDEQRGVIVMLSLSLAHALRIITDDRIAAWGGPDGCALAVYPVRDQTTVKHEFGSQQDWNHWRIDVSTSRTPSQDRTERGNV